LIGSGASYGALARSASAMSSWAGPARAVDELAPGLVEFHRRVAVPARGGDRGQPLRVKHGDLGRALPLFGVYMGDVLAGFGTINGK
jgi:hypothetical protein